MKNRSVKIPIKYPKFLHINAKYQFDTGYYWHGKYFSAKNFGIQLAPLLLPHSRCYRVRIDGSPSPPSLLSPLPLSPPVSDALWRAHAAHASLFWRQFRPTAAFVARRSTPRGQCGAAGNWAAPPTYPSSPAGRVWTRTALWILWTGGRYGAIACRVLAAARLFIKNVAKFYPTYFAGRDFSC